MGSHRSGAGLGDGVAELMRAVMGRRCAEKGIA